MGSPINVPTGGGLKESAKDMGVGALAGAGLAIIGKIFGGLGLIAAPILIGAAVKGDRGKMIATGAGVLVGLALLGGFGGGAQSSGPTSQGVM